MGIFVDLCHLHDYGGFYILRSPEHIYEFMNSFGVEGNIETLKMAPTRLFVLHMIDVLAEVEVDYLVVSKLVLKGHDYGSLRLLGGATKVMLM